jgi:hypothetical protein
MTRYGEKIEFTQNLLNDITFYMDGGIRERIHFEMAPCEPEAFLKRYLEIDPDFETVLADEFGIEM